MRWVTRSHLHLDRVATPWLISRFVEPSAEFEFVAWDVEPTEGGRVTWFGVPGVELGAHDADGTCFHKVLRRFQLEDPALQLMDRVVASGVAAALGTPPPDGQTEFEAETGAALNHLGVGMGVAFGDRQHLEVGMSLYEGIYAVCQVRSLSPTVRGELPGTMPERIAFLRDAVGRAEPGHGR